MNRYRSLAAAGILCMTLLSACAHENTYERAADRITKAMQANTLASVTGDIDPEMLKHITRVQVAEASQDLSPLGNIKTVKEVPCPSAAAAVHCIEMTFDKGTVQETIALDDRQKVTRWRYANPKLSP